MEIQTTGTVKSIQGLESINPFVLGIEGVDTYSKQYNLNVQFYTESEKKYNPFNIIKEEEEGVIVYFNQNIVLDFSDVIGIEGEEVDVTISNALKAKLILELDIFGLTEEVSN